MRAAAASVTAGEPCGGDVASEAQPRIDQADVGGGDLPELSIQASLIARRIYFMPWLIFVKAMPEPDFGPAYDHAGIGLNPENRTPIRSDHEIVVAAV